jgi:Sec-independent protein translocase protein TatA
MSAPAIVWLTVGLTTLLVLVAMVLGLARQLKLLAQSLAEFQAEIRPVLERMRDEADRAQERAERLRRTELSLPRRSRR